VFLSVLSQGKPKIRPKECLESKSAQFVFLACFESFEFALVSYSLVLLSLSLV